MNNRMESNNLNQSQGESNYSPPPNIYPNQSSLEMGANQFNSHEMIYQNENPSIGTSQDNPPAEQVGENQNSRPEETEEKKINCNRNNLYKNYSNNGENHSLYLHSNGHNEKIRKNRNSDSYDKKSSVNKVKYLSSEKYNKIEQKIKRICYYRIINRFS